MYKLFVGGLPFSTTDDESLTRVMINLIYTFCHIYILFISSFCSFFVVLTFSTRAFSPHLILSYLLLSGAYEGV